MQKEACRGLKFACCNRRSRLTRVFAAARTCSPSALGTALTSQTLRYIALCRCSYWQGGAVGCDVQRSLRLPVLCLGDLVA